MQFDTHTYTPEEARQVLETQNLRNYRKWADSTVQRYALDMANERWQLTGEAIKFAMVANGEGQLKEVLVDGQQRLMACVQANKPFVTVVIRNVNLDAAEVMDFGRKRDLSSILHRRGEATGKQLAAAINLGYRWEMDWLLSGRQPSPLEALEWLRLNPDIREGVRVANNMWQSLRTGPPSAMSVFTHRAQQLDAAEEALFRHALISGENLVVGHPVLALRRWLLSGIGAQTRPDSVTVLAYFIKAWNATMQGRNLSTVVWRREGTNREPFPVLVAKR